MIFSGCFLLLLWTFWKHVLTSTAFVPSDLRRYLMFPEGYVIPEKQLSETEIDSLILHIDSVNILGEVYNANTFGMVNDQTTIIAVQVHKDVERLQHLIISLGQVHFIQQAMLIFSHSYFDEEINKLIEKIDFCKYMQIFYPYSLQLHPDRFPGVDADDCDASARAAGAGLRGDCFDRDARRAMHKQHWWWKAHFIFEGLDLQSHQRVVVFLEEDDYVLPDFLYMLRFARRSLTYFPSVEVIALGRPYAVGLDYNIIIVDRWTPLYDRGVSFNLSTWRKIREKASYFCMYDDCSWSYSMMNLFGGFPGGLAEMAASKAPRVLASRALGGGRRAARRASELAARAQLFPGRVRAVVTLGAAGRVVREWRRPPHGNGGWSDLRDQMLCLSPVPNATVMDTNLTMTYPYSKIVSVLFPT